MMESVSGNAKIPLLESDLWVIYGFMDGFMGTSLIARNWV